MGAGYIGCEQASIFNNFGTEVHFIVRQVCKAAADPHAHLALECSPSTCIMTANLSLRADLL